MKYQEVSVPPRESEDVIASPIYLVAYTTPYVEGICHILAKYYYDSKSWMCAVGSASPSYFTQSATIVAISKVDLYKESNDAKATQDIKG